MHRWDKIYLELTKARLTALVVATTLVGFLLASGGVLDGGRLFWTVLGTAVAAGGANGLNQVWEVDRDRRMERTRQRPIPSGRMGRRHGFFFALALAAAGPVLLAAGAGPMAGLLGLSAVILYVFAYTPLKTRSPACTLVGAVCGAIPPMIGWAGAEGRLSLGAFVLGAILFVWQIPHFLSLAWIYREEYARASFRMLPVVDRGGSVTFAMVLLYSLGLLPVALSLTLAGTTGALYSVGSIVLGSAFLWLGVRLYRRRGAADARRLFLASIIYLPLLLGLMVADRAPESVPFAGERSGESGDVLVSQR